MTPGSGAGEGFHQSRPRSGVEDGDGEEDEAGGRVECHRRESGNLVELPGLEKKSHQSEQVGGAHDDCGDLTREYFLEAQQQKRRANGDCTDRGRR